MIQYSNINDAWGNKEIFKKNTLNIDKKMLPVSKEPKTDYIESVPAPVALTASINPVEPKILSPAPLSDNIIPLSNKIVNKPHEPFYAHSPCVYTEHLKQCEKCRNNMAEYFTRNKYAHIDIFGLDLTVSRDVLKIIFVIIIVIIFLIILSFVNVPITEELHIKPTATQMKYYMQQMPQMVMPQMNQMAQMQMNQLPYMYRY